MAWQTECINIVRFLINDLDCDNYEFTDQRLQLAFLVGAQLVLQELNFSQTYTVDVDSFDLTPDPTVGTKDNAFINLVSLKTACIIDKGRLKASLGVGMKVTKGTHSIDTTGSIAGYQAMLKDGNCKDYEVAKLAYLMGDSSPGQLIIGPYRYNGTIDQNGRSC